MPLIILVAVLFFSIKSSLIIKSFKNVSKVEDSILPGLGAYGKNGGLFRIAAGLQNIGFYLLRRCAE